MRLLLVEDDRMIGASLRDALRRDGYAVDWGYDARAALAALSSERFEAVLLDLGLPPPPAGTALGAASGLEVLQQLRSRGDATPVIVVTARDATSDRVSGLDAGADDYLVKPFDLDELKARIRALMRRQAGRAAPALEYAGLRLDPATREVTKGGVPVLLSAREYAVLEALMQRPGAVLTRAQLEDRLYGWGDAVESNAVSVYVHQLRRKLGAHCIGSMRGVGYFLQQGPSGA
jgi:two-component system response regulator QseB